MLRGKVLQASRSQEQPPAHCRQESKTSVLNRQELNSANNPIFLEEAAPHPQVLKGTQPR